MGLQMRMQNRHDGKIVAQENKTSAPDAEVVVLFKNVSNAYAKALEQFGFGVLIFGKAPEQLVGSVFQRQNFDCLGFGVHNPIFLDAKLFVQRAFFDGVEPPTAGGNNFDDEVGNAANGIFDNLLFRMRNKHNVRLHDAVL